MPDISNPEFAGAACVCWDLLFIGDATFPDQETCLATSEAFFYGIAFADSSCALPILAERQPDVAECYQNAAAEAVDCFMMIDECSDATETAYHECILLGQLSECGEWSDGTFNAVFDACAG